MAELDLVRARCRRLGGFSPAEPGFIEKLEHDLRLSLPNSFKVASTFFDGGGVAFLLHAIATEPQPNILNETLRLRGAVSLPENFVVLGEPPESLLLMDCNDGKVIWCDAIDVARLGDGDFARAPEVWPDFGDFLSHLLDLEEEERT